MRKTSPPQPAASPPGQAPAAPALQAGGPRGFPLLGHLPHVWRDPLPLFIDGMRRYGDVVRYDFGPYPFLLLNHPDHIRHVLLENARNYPKGPDYEALHLILGQGLLTSEGEVWRRQRRLAQPAFHHQALLGFVDAMSGATEEMLGRWAALPRGAVLDVHEEMMGLTLRIVCQTLFGSEITGDAGAVSKALTEVIRFINARTTALIGLPTWVPTPANLRFRQARELLDRLVYRIIDGRRRSGGVANDLLGLYMAATDESGGGRMSDRQLRDEVMTLVLAGHETTAVALSWTFDLLSRHPEAAARVRAEVREVLGDGPPTLESLERLTYTGWVLQESMRLYPPAWMITRQALADDDIAGHRVARGMILGVSPYVLHRSPAYWHNPEGFDPERFSPEGSRDRPRYAYLPFGGGPRTCIGNAFAMMEAKIILALVSRRTRLALVPGHRAQMEPSITLRPRHGVPVTLERD